eukprot:CAMPEP_0184395426 /NCGR_PEP_ID=MMETSP0007-20130409/44157_1 /TAXON_ID=97485 /ORGANISM="Prymnesium parvum, Strain Texoma1" /LENGTH=210 /DNA_ID=CAMNT_0026747581 /DNA_START=115 /DNA_END=744 /DNA_ORIENTATION=+
MTHSRLGHKAAWHILQPDSDLVVVEQPDIARFHRVNAQPSYRHPFERHDPRAHSVQHSTYLPVTALANRYLDLCGSSPLCQYSDIGGTGHPQPSAQFNTFPQLRGLRIPDLVNHRPVLLRQRDAPRTGVGHVLDQLAVVRHEQQPTAVLVEPAARMPLERTHRRAERAVRADEVVHGGAAELVAVRDEQPDRLVKEYALVCRAAGVDVAA